MAWVSFIHESFYIIQYSRSFCFLIESNCSDHKKDPIIVIDLSALNRVLESIDADGLTIGGRFDKVKEILDFFFAEIKNARGKLVFIVRLKERYQDIDEFTPIFEEYNYIAQNEHLKKPSNREKIKSPAFRPQERAFFNLIYICKQYGEVITTYSLKKRANLAYIKEHRDEVLAFISKNTEYCIHDMDCEYWSLSNIEYNTLKISRFDRQKLNVVLGLNKQQMQLMFAIAKVKPFRKGGTDAFLGAVKMMKKQVCGPNGCDLSKLAGITFTDDQREEVSSHINKLKDMDSFSGNCREDEYNELVSELVKDDAQFKTMLQYCKENNHFAYKLINETMTGLTDLLFIDVRRHDSDRFIDLVVNILLKAVGIAFKDIEPDKRPKTRLIQTKRKFKEESVKSEMAVIYPNGMSYIHSIWF